MLSGLPVADGVPTQRVDVDKDGDGRVLVDIKADVTDALLQYIRTLGGNVVNDFPQYHAIRAGIPLASVENVASRSDVRFVGPAVRAVNNSVDSQGDYTHQANTARSTFGVNGSGLTIGVLSDSVDHLTNSQIAGLVTVLPGQSGSPAMGEGTAMLEIVNDLAPGAQLYFATTAAGEASFANNIQQLQAAGCNIIVDDGLYDDESPFQDGIVAQAVNSVTASGVLYFSSANNAGNKDAGTSGTWEGDFADSGVTVSPPSFTRSGRVHSFGSAEYDTVLGSGPGGTQLRADLFWSDPLGASTNDYDLYVLDPTGSHVMASSTTSQTGFQDPYEQVPAVSNAERIVIVKYAGDGRFLHLSTGRGELSISTQGSTRGHDCATNAFDVAAVNAAASYPGSTNPVGPYPGPFSGGAANPVETFSSDGPRRVFYQADGTPITSGNFSSTGGAVRQKPDFTAADGVATDLPSGGLNPFFGTSAATPHTAAIAALLKSYNPALTPSQIRTILSNTALDVMATGMDRDSGAGIVMALRALQQAPKSVSTGASGSVAGKAIFMHVLAGTYPFMANSGYSLLIPADSGTSYQAISVYNLPGGQDLTEGTYIYSAPGPSKGLFTFTDGTEGTVAGRFNFITSSSGGYILTNIDSWPIVEDQSGEFEMLSGQALPSVAGRTFHCTVDHGVSPFANAGTFALEVAALGDSYIIAGDGTHTFNSAGTYSFAPVNMSTATMQLQDSLAGAITAYFAFSEGGTGRYLVIQSSSSVFQVGHFTMNGASNPRVKISSPKSAEHFTNPAINVRGTTTDSVTVTSVLCQVEGNNWVQATGTTDWSASVTASPGANVARAYASDINGNLSPIDSVSFVYVLSAPLVLQKSGLGTITPNLAGQMLQVGNAYSLTAKPGSGYLFSNWTGSVPGTTPKLWFVMQTNTDLQANFVPNPFPPVAGIYQGLFYDTNTVVNQSSGFFSATLASKGGFTAHIQLAGKTYSFLGQFAPAGTWSNSIVRRRLAPLSVQLEMDFANGGLTGQLSDGTWMAELAANRRTYSRTNPAPERGAYTLAFPGSDNSAVQPGGDGFGTVTVDSSGNVTFAGTLGDGAKVAQKTIVSGQSEWPLYLSPYSSNGCVVGWLTFTNLNSSDICGPVTWIRLAQPASKYYPVGFTNQTEGAGSAYKSTNGIPVMNFTTGQVRLVSGNLPQGITNQIALSTANKITNQSSNKLSLTILPSSGRFKGSVGDPASSKTISFNGVILEKQDVGYGLFLGTNQTGRVYFGP